MDQSECALKFPDSPSVADADLLLRRVPPWHFYLDENIGRIRPSSAAFEDDQDGDPMSVYLSPVIDSEMRKPESVLAGHSEYALAGLTAAIVRQQRQTVHTDPADDTAHAVVCGPKTDRTRRTFAKQCQWVIPPPTTG